MSTVTPIDAKTIHEQNVDEAVDAGCTEQGAQHSVQEQFPGYADVGLGVRQGRDEFHGFCLLSHQQMSLHL